MFPVVAIESRASLGTVLTAAEYLAGYLASMQGGSSVRSWTLVGACQGL
jgi:hypothetical protein